MRAVKPADMRAQMLAFAGAGVGAAVVHYGVLSVLVLAAGMGAVSAALAGYVAGGLVSYGLNRAYTYTATRSHPQAGWRFALVASGGFLCTFGLMHALVDLCGVHWLLAQMITTLLVMGWSFAAHKFWSFRDQP